MKKNYFILLCFCILSASIFAQVDPPANVRMKMNFEEGYAPRAGLIWDEDVNVDHYKVYLDGEDYECFSCGYYNGTFEGYAYFGIYYSLNGTFEENVYHNCGVSAFDVNGLSSDTISFNFYFSETAYSRPSNLRIINNLDESKAYFYWDSPPFGNGSDQPYVTGYSVLLDGIWMSDTDYNEFTFTGLTLDKNYMAGVVARYSDGHSDSTFYPNYAKKEFYFNTLPKVEDLEVNQTDGTVSWKVPNNSENFIGGTLNAFNLGLSWNWCGTQDYWLKIGDVDDDIFVNSVFSFNKWMHNDAQLGDDSEAISFIHIFMENPPPYTYARFEGRNINEITQNSTFNFVAPLRANNDAETNGGTGSMVVHYNEENGIYGVVRVDDLYNLHFDEYEMPWFSLDLTWWVQTEGGHDFSEAFNYYPKWYLVYLEDVLVDTVRSTCETFNNTDFTYQLQNLEQGISYTLGLIAEYNVGKSPMETVEFTIANSATDLSVEEITSPVSGNNLGFEEVTIVVKNNGTVSQTDIPVNYKINGTTLGYEVISGPVGPGESVEYTFFELANVSSPGTTYAIEACTALLDDVVPENDCLSAEITNTIVANPEIHVTPGSITQTLEPGTTASRSLTIENNGDAPLYFDLSLDDVKDVKDGSGLCIDNLYSGGCMAGDGLVFWNLANVSIMEIPCSGNPSWYHDYTDMAHVLQPGETYQLSVMGGSYDAYLDIWIDFDDDFELTDDEIVLNDGSLFNKNTFYYFDITIPSTATIGNHAMRARTSAWNPVTDPCASYDMGNCLDFTATTGGSTPTEWLTADITSGTIEPGGAQQITLTFNSEGLENGTYEKTISITSNDPQNPVVEVPVTLNVLESTQPWEVTVTDKVHFINVPASANPNIYGQPLGTGDWIGVFYINDEGYETCGGAAMIDASGNATVLAYGDDETTPDKDGFSDNEIFRWKLYSTAWGEEFTASATYDQTMPNQALFAELGLSQLTSLSAMLCQYYSFNKGWNSISSYLIPNDTDVEIMFGSLGDQLVAINNLTSIYWPGVNVNTIGNFDNSSGYAIKVTENAGFNVGGMEYADNGLTLEQGWQYMPVLSECDVNTMDLFEENLENLVIVQDLIGYKVFWPEMEIYNLETLEPGKAYKVKAADGFSIAYPECYGETKFKVDAQVNSLTTLWGEMKMTPATQVTAIKSEAMTGFRTGDLLGAFGEDGNIFGFLQVENTHQNQGVTLFGDDATTDGLNGFTNGEPVSYKLYRTTSGEEFDLEVEYDNTMENNTGKYQSGSFAAITNLTMKNTETGLIQNSLEIYPNPANDELSIKLNNSESGIVSLTIMDAKGQIIVEKTFTDKIILNVSSYPGGIYFVKINTGSFNEVRKIVIK